MIVTIIGFAGMCCILFAFAMNQFHKWKAKDPIYDAVNLLGGTLLVVYSILIKSYPFIGLNSVWVVVSFVELIRDSKKKKESHLSHKRKL